MSYEELLVWATQQTTALAEKDSAITFNIRVRLSPRHKPLPTDVLVDGNNILVWDTEARHHVPCYTLSPKSKRRIHGEAYYLPHKALADAVSSRIVELEKIISEMTETELRKFIGAVKALPNPTSQALLVAMSRSPVIIEKATTLRKKEIETIK